MKRIIAILITLIFGALLTSTVIGISGQSPKQSTNTSKNETFIKQLGGSVYAVAKQGNYAYIGAGKSLIVLDVQDPTNPQQVGNIDQLDFEIYSLTISGTVAFAPKEKGIRIFDISQPTNPELLDTYALPSTYVGDIVISGTLAFVPEKPTGTDNTTTGGLRILDVSDPQNISQITIFGENDGVEAVALDGNYAYLAYHEHSTPSTYSSKTVVLDISTINFPNEIHRSSNGTSDVAVYGNYLYVIDNGLEIYNISTPSTPNFVNKINVTDFTKVFIDNDTLYITSRYRGIEIFDLTDPENPSNQRSFSTNGAIVNDLIAEGNIAYVANTIAGLKLINVQAPISEVGTFNSFGYPHDALKHNGYIYVLDEKTDLQILNAADPLNPQTVGSYEVPTTFYSMQIHNDNLYLTGQTFFYILDASNPISPTYITYYSGSDRIKGLIIDGNYAYVGRNSAQEGSLEIVDISDKANPTQVATIGTSQRVFQDGAIVGTYYFMSERKYSSLIDSQFHVIDISNPESPQIVKTLAFQGETGDLAIIGNYAYLANTGRGIQIINISDPLNPVVEDTFTIPNGSAYDYWVKAVDGQLYVAALDLDTPIMLDIFDVTNPTSPTKVGEFGHFIPSLRTLIEDVEVNGYYYYPSRKDGLLIYECHDCIVLDKNVYLPFVIKN